MRTALCALLVFFTGLALAAQDDELWIVGSSATDTYRWDIKKGSLEYSKNRNGDDIVAVLGRRLELSTKTYVLQKWYVTNADCDREMGLLVVLNVQGQYVYENDFMFGSSTVASRLAGLICSAREIQLKKGMRL